MARLVYACRFDIGEEDAWRSVVAPAYQQWISNRYQRAHSATIQVDLAKAIIEGGLPKEHGLQIKQYASERPAVGIDWSFPGDEGLVWRNLVRIAALPDCCAVEHQVYVESVAYLLAPASFNVGTPGVIRALCEEHPISVGDMQLRAVVYPLGIDGIEGFVGLLGSPLRRLPIILVTPFANGDRNDLDASSLAARLAGVAVVAQADGPDATRALSDRIGRLGCYDGGVRIYWPGFQSRDDVRRHPLMFGSRVALIGAPAAMRSLERSIFSVAAFRFVPDPRIEAITSEFEAARRADRAAAAREANNWEQYALEISEELDGARAELAGLVAENANLRENQRVLFAFSEDEADHAGAQEIIRNPTSVLEAVTYGSDDFSNLLFLDTAAEAAQKSPFRRPGEVYEALSVMDKIAGTWRRNEGGGDLRQMLIDGGLGRRVSNFISQTSKGKWGDEYKFLYNDKRQLFEWHVTLGAGAADTCASIHFLPDAEAGKLVIGHVGRHLSNTRS